MTQRRNHLLALRDQPLRMENTRAEQIKRSSGKRVDNHAGDDVKVHHPHPAAGTVAPRRGEIIFARRLCVAFFNTPVGVHKQLCRADSRNTKHRYSGLHAG